MADFFDLLITRRSIRDFEETKVPLGLIAEWYVGYAERIPDPPERNEARILKILS